MEEFAGYKVHPLASLWPLMPQNKLFDSIEADGVIHKVVLDQNKRIVDGRNRAKIWAEVAANNRDLPNPADWWESSHPLPVEVRHFEDDSAVWEFIVAVNEKRRHMTEDQLAAVNAAADDFFKAAREAKERSQFKPGVCPNPGGVPKSQARTDSCEPEEDRNHKEEHRRSTVGRIAEAAGVSHHKAAQAVAIKKADPELLKKVAQGEVKLKDAAKVVQKPKPVKQKVMTDGEVVHHAVPENPVAEDPLDICLVQLERMSRNEIMILRDECNKRI